MHRILGAAVVALTCAIAPAQAEDMQKMNEEARKVAVELLTQVRGELLRELEQSGPLKALVVCKYTVPEITSMISRRTGWRVTRVSLRPRNPALGGADAWEQKILMEFESRVQRGESAEGLEHAEIVTEPSGRFYRFMKVIPLAQPCMTCHGPAEKMSPAQRAQLANEYPFDRATGFTPGQVRGATSVKRPL